MSNELQTIADSNAESDAWLTEENATLESDSRGVDTGVLPVRLCFRAGSLTMPLSTLSRVGAGFVFELDKRLDDQVITIHANDTPIAVGELVALGDLIGVRVTRMLPKP